MKKVKKILAMALATTLVASTTLLGGCSKTPAADEAVTIDIFQFKVEAKDAIEKAASEYKKTHENVNINIQTIGGGEDYGVALRAKFQSGEEPTIFNIGGPQDTLDWAEKLEDLTDADLTKQAFDGTLGAVTKDGKVYGFPFAMEGYGFVYNKAIFEKAGVDASKIVSYADLEAAVKTLDSKKTDLGIDSVFALPGKEKWVTGLHTSNAVFSTEFADSQAAYTAKEIEFKYSDQLKKLIDIQMNYGYKPDGTQSSINGVDYSTQVEKQFSKSKAAIIQQGNWVYGGVKGIDATLAENIGILPMPIDGVKDGTIPVGVPMYWSVNSKKTDAEKKAAKDFLNWLYTSDAGKEMIIKDFNFVPAYKGYDTDELQPADPLSKDIVKFVKAEKNTPWVFMGYPTGWGENQLGVGIQKYISGESAWDAVITQAKADWKEARK